jgi:hypothetical protein
MLAPAHPFDLFALNKKRLGAWAVWLPHCTGLLNQR